MLFNLHIIIADHISNIKLLEAKSENAFFSPKKRKG
jgi:hypothetical protein